MKIKRNGVNGLTLNPTPSFALPFRGSFGGKKSILCPLNFPHFPSLSLHPNNKNMPIELPRGLPFSVDTWSPNSNRKRHHFLTHAHKDHTSGILTHSCYPIYTTHLTKLLVLQNYPQVCVFCGFFELPIWVSGFDFDFFYVYS